MTSTTSHHTAPGAASALDAIRSEVRALSETLWAARPARELTDTVVAIESLKSTLDALVAHWIDGGPTNLANLLLLCGHHHRLIHSGPWQVHLDTTGHAQFTPPPGTTRERLVSPRSPPRE